MKKLSVYVHIPFCERKCEYCDFVSFNCGENTRQEYLQALIEEIKAFDSNGYVVDSIFFGGGTPTLLTATQFESIVDCIKQCFVLDLQEFTVEGNPNSYSHEKVQLYKKLGVTRLSVGVQSLDDKVLKGIGRVHNAVQGVECLKMLAKSGLDINCDMMVGLPYQTLDIVRRDIQKVVDIGVNSVSCYSLILEDGTPIFEKVKNGEVVLPDEDTTTDMFDIASNILQKSGLNAYEISNFGKPCLHNIGYWTLKEYVGFGLSSHSLIDNTRYYNTSSMTEYLTNRKWLVEEQLSLDDMCNEYIMLALRMSTGIDTQYFANKFGEQKLNELKCKINDKKNIKYYNITNNNISIKPQYIYVSNGLIADLI